MRRASRRKRRVAAAAACALLAAVACQLDKAGTSATGGGATDGGGGGGDGTVDQDGAVGDAGPLGDATGDADGGCPAGACPPETVFTWDREVFAVAVDQGAMWLVYNGNDSTTAGVYEVPSGAALPDGGGAVRRVTANLAWQVALSQRRVYFTQQTSGLVYAPRNATGGPGTVMLSAFGCVTVPGGSNDVYVVDRQGSRIVFFESATDASVPLAQGLSAPWGVASQGGDLWWTSQSPPGSVHRMKRDGGGDTTVVPGLANPGCVTVAGTVLYFTTLDGGEIWRANLDGSGAVVIASGQLHPTQVSVDGAYLYWNSGQKVMRQLR